MEPNDEEYKRLEMANQTKKWGHLRSWKELYLFQRYIGLLEQNKEIGMVAKRNRAGEKITLPFMDYKGTLVDTSHLPSLFKMTLT